MHWREVIRRPVITEKSNYQSGDLDQYAFVVDIKANKLQIADAIERAFPGAKVDKVRVMVMPAKRGRRQRNMIRRKPAYKKAIVTLSEGSIDVFEGVG